MSVFVKNFLKLNPGAQVIADVKSCDALFDTIKQFGGIGLMEKVGHSFIKARMKSTGALLASELSGHFFFKDRWYGFDDGIYAALRAIEIVCEDKTAFDDVHSGIVTPEIRITCDEDKKEEIIKNVRMQLEKYNVSFVAIDGVRVTSEQGWWILRSSNTENSLSLRIEAYSIEHMQELMNNVVGYLQEHIHNIREIIDLQYNKDEDV